LLVRFTELNAQLKLEAWPKPGTIAWPTIYSTSNEGTAAVYRSCNGEPPAVAFVSRFDRIGWLLNQIKGPDNVDLEQSRVVSHQTDFLNAGIPDYIDVMAIKEVILEGRFPRLRN
jgi:hypothetical protein